MCVCVCVCVCRIYIGMEDLVINRIKKNNPQPS